MKEITRKIKTGPKYKNERCHCETGIYCIITIIVIIIQSNIFEQRGGGWGGGGEISGKKA